jgi:hypothetical protein
MMRAPHSLGLRSIVLSALIGAALVGCGDKAATKKSDEDTSSSAKPSGGGGKAAAQPPKDVDAKVTAALDKLATCKREDDRMADCAEEEAWKTFREGFVENDEDGAKHKKLALACLARVGHESPNVRGKAADCVREDSDTLADPKAALELVLDQLEKETAPDASMELSYAVTALDPVKQGLGDRTLAVVKKMHAKEQTGTGEVLGALGKGKAPPGGAVDLALEILKSGKGPVESSMEVLENAPARKAEACVALLVKVRTGKYLWSRAMNGMGRLGCTNEMDAVVDFVVTKMAEDEGYEKGFLGADFAYLQRVLNDVALTKDQVGKLKKATTELKGKSKNANVPKDCDELLAALDKE